MADLSNVETALVQAIIAIIYPNGKTAASVLKMNVKAFRGMPSSGLLLADRASGILDISVFPVPGATRDTTRWGVQTFDIPSTPGLTVAVVGNSATFAGIAAPGDLAGILAGQTAYVYQTQPNDTAALVAAVLAGQIVVNTTCSVDGASLTMSALQSIVARTAAAATALQELGRQEQEFRISVWAPNPQVRDQACSFVTAGLAAISFLTLADGSGGRIRYKSTASIDDDQASSIYRRDLIYTVEYATTIALQTPTVLFGDDKYNGTTILV
jgi:hypothetical protein